MSLFFKYLLSGGPLELVVYKKESTMNTEMAVPPRPPRRYVPPKVELF